MATRQAVFARVYPTADWAVLTAEAPGSATEMVAEAATLVAEGELTWAAVTEEAVDLPPPTPAWDPAASPLLEATRRVAICQERNRPPLDPLVRSTIEEIKWESVTVDGDTAEVEAEMEFSWEYESEVVHNNEFWYQFRLRHVNGVWKLEDQQFSPIGGW
jgi:hypothetical protein